MVKQKNNQKRLKAKPSIITIYRCTRVIIPQKWVRFVFGQSRGSWGVFFIIDLIPGCARL